MKTYVVLIIYSIILFFKGVVLYFVWNNIITSILQVNQMSLLESVLLMFGITLLLMKVKIKDGRKS